MSEQHFCSVHHLFQLLLRVVPDEWLRGCGRTLFVWLAEVENTLFPPVHVHLLLRSQFDPVGEVLQGAVLEVVAGAERFGKGERGPTLEDPVTGPDIVVHVWVDGRSCWTLVSPLWRPQRWNILGKDQRTDFRDHITDKKWNHICVSLSRKGSSQLYVSSPHIVPVQFCKDAEVCGVRDPSMEDQHLLVNHCCQWQPAENFLQQLKDSFAVHLRRSTNSKFLLIPNNSDGFFGVFLECEKCWISASFKIHYLII